MGPGCSSLPPGLLPWEGPETRILSLKAFRELPIFGKSFTMFTLLSVWGDQPQDLTLRHGPAWQEVCLISPKCLPGCRS